MGIPSCSWLPYDVVVQMATFFVKIYLDLLNDWKLFGHFCWLLDGNFWQEVWHICAYTCCVYLVTNRNPKILISQYWSHTLWPNSNCRAATLLPFLNDSGSLIKLSRQWRVFGILVQTVSSNLRKTELSCVKWKIVSLYYFLSCFPLSFKFSSEVSYTWAPYFCLVLKERNASVVLYSIVI